MTLAGIPGYFYVDLPVGGKIESRNREHAGEADRDRITGTGRAVDRTSPERNKEGLVAWYLLDH